FANPSMRALLPGASVGVPLGQLVDADHPLRRLAEETLKTRESRGPTAATFPDRGQLPEPDQRKRNSDGVTGERLILTHPVSDPKGDLVGAMLIARNLEYLSQVQSTIRYSRKLAALGRLS